jgi:hypothetical protein
MIVLPLPFTLSNTNLGPKKPRVRRCEPPAQCTRNCSTALSIVGVLSPTSTSVQLLVILTCLSADKYDPFLYGYGVNFNKTALHHTPPMVCRLLSFYLSDRCHMLLGEELTWTPTSPDLINPCESILWYI